MLSIISATASVSSLLFHSHLGISYSIPTLLHIKSFFKQKQRIVLLYTILCFLFHQSTVTIGLILVEVRGVEPLSENIAIQLSPSADVILYFALRLPDDGPSHCYPKEFPLKPIGISLKVSHY